MQEKFQLLKARNFNETIDDSISFMTRYYKSIGYVILVLVVPVYILGSFIYANVMPMGFDLKHNLNMFNNLGKVAGSAAAGGLVLMIGRALLTVVFVSAFIHVEQSDTGELTDRDIFGSIKTYLGRLVGFYLLAFLLAFVAILLIAGIVGVVAVMMGKVASVLLLFLLGLGLVVGIIYIAIPLVFVPIIYMREMCGLTEAISRAFYLVRGNWWWTFLMLLVAGMIGGIVALVFQAPYLALTLYRTYATIKGIQAGMETSLIDRLALTLQNFGGIIVYTIATVVAYMQYYSLVEKKDGLDLMNRIEGIGANDVSNQTGIGSNDTNY